MITASRNQNGSVTFTALVKDKNPNGNPWGSPFYHSLTMYGYAEDGFEGSWDSYTDYLRETFLDCLTRDGLVVVED
jgi:hypothetical protein